MSWPALKMNFTQESFRTYVETLQWTKWRPSKIIWHNTGAPTLKQWIESAQKDSSKGLIPGITRIRNLEKYFRDDNNWSGCPHLFIANDFIWVMNDLTQRGTHSPSFNSSSIGIEMIGDFSKENDDEGEGLKVKINTIFATAILCEAIGIDPSNGETDRIRKRILGGSIFLHKQDWATSHDCPGEGIARDKLKMIEEVQGLMEGGEENFGSIGKVIGNGVVGESFKKYNGVVSVNGLNFRVGPGVSNYAKGKLDKGVKVEVLGEALNGNSKWLKVRSPRGFVGWVSGKYVERKD